MTVKMGKQTFTCDIKIFVMFVNISSSTGLKTTCSHVCYRILSTSFKTYVTGEKHQYKDGKMKSNRLTCVQRKSLTAFFKHRKKQIQKTVVRKDFSEKETPCTIIYKVMNEKHIYMCKFKSSHWLTHVIAAPSFSKIRKQGWCGRAKCQC